MFSLNPTISLKIGSTSSGSTPTKRKSRRSALTSIRQRIRLRNHMLPTSLVKEYYAAQPKFPTIPFIHFFFGALVNLLKRNQFYVDDDIAKARRSLLRVIWPAFHVSTLNDACVSYDLQRDPEYRPPKMVVDMNAIAFGGFGSDLIKNSTAATDDYNLAMDNFPFYAEKNKQKKIQKKRNSKLIVVYDKYNESIVVRTNAFIPVLEIHFHTNNTFNYIIPSSLTNTQLMQHVFKQENLKRRLKTELNDTYKLISSSPDLASLYPFKLQKKSKQMKKIIKKNGKSKKVARMRKIYFISQIEKDILEFGDDEEGNFNFDYVDDKLMDMPDSFFAQFGLRKT